MGTVRRQMTRKFNEYPIWGPTYVPPYFEGKDLLEKTKSSVTQIVISSTADVVLLPTNFPPPPLGDGADAHLFVEMASFISSSIKHYLINQLLSTILGGLYFVFFSVNQDSATRAI